MPDPAEPRPEEAEARLGPLTILPTGRRADDRAEPSAGIDAEMPLAPVDLLAGIGPPAPPFAVVLPA
jgi:hypothetical protein